jgi:hypothetical protein
MDTSTALREGTPQPDVVFDPLVVLDGLVSTLQSVESAIAGLQALREYTLALASRVADVMADDGGQPGRGAGSWDLRSAELAQRAVAAEIATATRMNDRAVQRQMGQAVELLDRFPSTFEALAHGRISLAHVRVIQDAGTALENPDALHERAVADRCVRVNPLPDGMAELAATLPAAVAYGILDRLTRMAGTHADLAAAEHTASGPTEGHDTPAGETRCIDQLRADLFAELLLRGAPTGHDTPDGLLAAITPRVEVTVPVLALIDNGSAWAMDSTGTGYPGRVPAELYGRHPIDPATARLLAGRATGWNRVLTDPITGAVLAVDRYRPGEDIKRILTARDSRCRFPGCGIPARDLDLDHTHDAAQGGPTEAANLAGLCRRHHTLKHHSGWTVRQAGGGTLHWSSPTGRSYTDTPPTPATYCTPKPPEPPPF